MISDYLGIYTNVNKCPTYITFIYFPMDFILCYSRFDHPRFLQTLIQMMASKFVVVVISSKLPQYSEGVNKFGVGCPPTSTKGSPIR